LRQLRRLRPQGGARRGRPPDSKPLHLTGCGYVLCGKWEDDPKNWGCGCWVVDLLLDKG